MKKICISDNWLYNAPDHIGWKTVDLPNDYSITQPRSEYAQGAGSNGFFMGGIGTYVKKLKLAKDKRYILDIDGAYMLTQISLNKNEIAIHPHGYTPFLVDLTDGVRPDEENLITITTNALQTSTRWYSGAGIYRDVFLWEGNDIRLEPWDTFITTPNLNQVNVAYDVSSEREADIVIRSEILDKNGISISLNDTHITVKQGKNPVRIGFTLDNSIPWDTDNPYLYTLKTQVLEGDEVIDESKERFGIRTITADTEHGLRLNGKTVKLRGGCIHHDHGVLGAADYPAACKRKLTKLKDAGFNALRIAHNPPSEQLLDMADEMGIIIMDEAFDCWVASKGDQLNYNNWFKDWWESDITYMVKRDRRHPSVICFSTGNEIPESVGTKNGYEFSAKLAAKIRSLDPTRLVTSCTWQIGGKELWAERTAAYYAPYDICGYNYMYPRYSSDKEMFPNRVIWGSETWALTFYDSWKAVMDNTHVIGDFTWTAYDNIGEAGTGASCWARDGHIDGIRVLDYPWRTCYQGDFDLCGYRRPQSYFREAIFIGGKEPRIFTTHPEHYGEDFSGTSWHWYDVNDSWTFDDAYLGKPVKCDVYTDAEEIEWILNGRILGRSKPEKAIATFDVNYERGTLTAIAYKNGIECGRSSLSTVGKFSNIVLNPETDSLEADGRDLCYIQIFAADENGERIPDSNAELTCNVIGGELMGIFSGDPKNEDNYGSNSCHAFEGRAVAIIRTKTKGCVQLTVNSVGANEATVSIIAR